MRAPRIQGEKKKQKNKSFRIPKKQKQKAAPLGGNPRPNPQKKNT
jgi:hypothetical protein